jgi:hypothetical protein
MVGKKRRLENEKAAVEAADLFFYALDDTTWVRKINDTL